MELVVYMKYICSETKYDYQGTAKIYEIYKKKLICKIFKMFYFNYLGFNAEKYANRHQNKLCNKYFE